MYLLDVHQQYWEERGFHIASLSIGAFRALHRICRKRCIDILSLFTKAAEGGHLPLLERLHERGPPVGFSLAEDALFLPSAECLHYVLDCVQHDENFLNWLTAFVVQTPHTACIKTLYDRGCLPRSGELWAMMARMHAKLCVTPKLRWACLTLLVANSGPPPRHLLCTSVKHPLSGVHEEGGDVATLRYVHECGAPWDEGTLCGLKAVHLDFLRYAHENGCPWGLAKLSCFVQDLYCLQEIAVRSQEWLPVRLQRTT